MTSGNCSGFPEGVFSKCTFIVKAANLLICWLTGGSLIAVLPINPVAARYYVKVNGLGPWTIKVVDLNKTKIPRDGFSTFPK